MDPSRTISLEIAGPAAEPGTVDTLPALELAAAYVAALEQVAMDKGSSLEFRGIRIKNKCVEFAFGVANKSLAESSVIDLTRYLGGVLLPNKRMRQPLERLRKAVAKQNSTGHKVSAAFGRAKHELLISEPKMELLPSSTFSARVKINRAGGKDPGVRFESESEGMDFSLDTTEQQAAEVAHHLYKTAEIVANVLRGPDGRITGGRLLEFRPPPTEDVNAFLKWLDVAGEGWSTAEEGMKELDRD